MLNLLTRLFGSRNDRIVKGYEATVRKAAAFETALQALSDEALGAKTVEFRKRLAEGATLNDLAPEAFAVVREASRRTMRMRHFDVQLIGGLTLNDGRIAEMRTGEGKTLMSTLAAYLNALTGEGVHVVTVNEYLAQRDADWMSPIYRFLGLTVGVIRNQQDPTEKRAAYRCDITYGTNNEFGFDYLRDNLAFSLDDKVQRGLVFAIVDEVDSILIDEARTPLIIRVPPKKTKIHVKVNAPGRGSEAARRRRTRRLLVVDEKLKRTSPKAATRRTKGSWPRPGCRAKARARPAEHRFASPECGAEGARNINATRNNIVRR